MRDDHWKKSQKSVTDVINRDTHRHASRQPLYKSFERMNRAWDAIKT